MGVKRFSFLTLLGVDGVGGPNHPGHLEDLDRESLVVMRQAIDAAAGLIRERCGAEALDLQAGLLVAVDQALQRTSPN